MLPLERLLVIAAPSCCGKSTFINKIKNDELNDISATLDLGDATSWSYEDAFYVDRNFMARVSDSPGRKMILHWTIPRPTLKLWLRNLVTGFSYDRKERLALLAAAEQLTILSLYCGQHNLQRGVKFRRKRALQRLQEKSGSRLVYLRQRWNMWRLTRLYSNMENVVPMYERWLGFCQTLDARDSYLVDLDENDRLIPVDEWSTVRNSWINAG